MIQFISLVICIIGVLTYALAQNPKAAEIGRISFAIGLFFCLAQVVGIR